MAPHISVELANVPEQLTRGEFLVPTVRIRNDSTDFATVSARLNLFEGDLVVWCTPPDGERIGLQAPVTVDSLPRDIDLPPDGYLEAGIILSYTSHGLTFNTLGPYRLVAEYDPGQPYDTVESNPVEFKVVEATTPKARELASLTTCKPVARAIALGGLDEPDPDTADQIKTMAEDFADRREGVISFLTLATATELPEHVLRSAFDTMDPVTVARWIRAVTAPATAVHDTAVGAAFLDYLDQVDMAETSTARRIIHGNPIE